jgi:hypothetical protein
VASWLYFGCVEIKWRSWKRPIINTRYKCVISYEYTLNCNNKNKTLVVFLNSNWTNRTSEAYNTYLIWAEPEQNYFDILEIISHPFHSSLVLISSL